MARKGQLTLSGESSKTRHPNRFSLSLNAPAGGNQAVRPNAFPRQKGYFLQDSYYTGLIFSLRLHRANGAGPGTVPKSGLAAIGIPLVYGGGCQQPDN
jgi:hypothetical protein